MLWKIGEDIKMELGEKNCEDEMWMELWTLVLVVFCYKRVSI
jgi:hypothetical protein